MKKMDLFKPGDQFKNYQIVRKLAKGGQAVAYLVQDKKRNKRVLKVSEITQDNAWRIKGQYKFILQFDHPNIIKVYEYYRQQIQEIQYLFIIMEYAQVGDLKGFMGKLTVQGIFKIYYQVKEVIQYLHARGVIHRDLTLSNILCDKMLNIKVIIDGIANQLQQSYDSDDYDHFRNRKKNPPQFLQNRIFKQSDLWQFGIILIQLVTGKEIFQLTNKQIQAQMKNFPDQVFNKYNVNNKFRSIISPLLKYGYKERKFCDDTIIMIKSQVSQQEKQFIIKQNQKKQKLLKMELQRWKTQNQNLQSQNIKLKQRISQLQKKLQQITLKNSSFYQSHLQSLRKYEQDIQNLNNTINNILRYSKIKKIGQGGFAQIFLCKDLGTNQKKVMKISSLDNNKFSEKDVSKIRKQARLLTQLSHPNLIKVEQFWQSNNYFQKQSNFLLNHPKLSMNIILEYIEGGDLQNYLGKLEPYEIKTIYKKLKQTIEYLHKNHIVHRDITKRNILIKEFNGTVNPIIIDLGISSQLDQNNKLLITSSGMGTNFYKPPQLFMEFPKVSPALDMWGLGIIMLQLILGKSIDKIRGNNLQLPGQDASFPSKQLQQIQPKYFLPIISGLLNRDYNVRKMIDIN